MNRKVYKYSVCILYILNKHRRYKMKIEDVVRETKDELKDVRINLKTTKSIAEWLTKENVSPQKVFDLSIVELMNEVK